MKPPPIRLWIGVMIFFTTFTNYMLRANMSVSIISMVAKPSKNFTPACRKDEPTKQAKANATETKDFTWSENEVGMVLSAYFWGYIISVMPGGILSEILGPFHVIFWTSLVSAGLTALSPISAHKGEVPGLAAVRFITGLLGGVVYPAVNVLIAKWAPPKEKGKFLAAMMGNTLGTVVTFNAVSFSTVQWGWEWGFYVLAIMMAVFCLFFGILVRDTPDQHKWISEEEKEFIRHEQEGHVSKKKKVPPYLKILTSRAFWITVIAQFGNLWGLNLIMTYGPKYLAETVGFDLKESAFLAALPYIGRLIFGSIFGSIGDYMQKKEIMTKTKIRKFFIIFSHYIPAAFMFLIILAECNAGFIVAMLVLNQAFNGAVVVGHLITPQDMSPNFAGTVYGMMNFIGMTTGIFVPMITGAFNSAYNKGVEGAQWIYGIGGAVFALSGVVFMLFAQPLVQPWNEIPETAEA